MFKVTFIKQGFIQRVLFFEVATEERAQELAEYYRYKNERVHIEREH